jgi:hypothetical protein
MVAADAEPDCTTADFLVTSFLACEGESGIVLKIEILRNGTITKATDGIPYIRKVHRNCLWTRLKALRGCDSIREYLHMKIIKCKLRCLSSTTHSWLWSSYSV